MAEQAKELKDCLDAAITCTEEFAPVREAPYPLEDRGRNSKLPLATVPISEIDWERAIWNHRGTLVGPWRKLVSFQVMTRNHNTDKDWGEIDLLATSSDGLPIVIELKSNPSECVLAAIMEGVAYAVALRKAWTTCFKDQWYRRTTLGDIALSPTKAGRLDPCQVMVLAPACYWHTCIGPDEPPRRRNQVSKPAWKAIGELSTVLASTGFLIKLVELSEAGAGIWKCREVPMPPGEHQKVATIVEHTDGVFQVQTEQTFTVLEAQHWSDAIDESKKLLGMDELFKDWQRVPWRFEYCRSEDRYYRQPGTGSANPGKL